MERIWKMRLTKDIRQEENTLKSELYCGLIDYFFIGTTLSSEKL